MAAEVAPQAAPAVGVMMYVLSGLLGASFYLPLKKVKGWAWESFWAVYGLTALVLVPWILALIFSPNIFSVFGKTPGDTIAYCLLFGAMWGVGGLTWGLGIRYLGFGLGLAIACGSCAAFGTLVPPIAYEVTGKQVGAFTGLFGKGSGQATLAGVAISLLGIIVTGMAGMSKEGELSEEQKKASISEFNLKKGLLLAIFAGIMSAGMSFGFRAGDPIKALAESSLPPDATKFWLGLPVLVVILFGGFVVNFGWCMFLNTKNRTGGDYLKKDVPVAANFLLAAAAGVIWYSQMLLYTAGDTNIGSYKYSGWSMNMSSQILFSSLIGIMLLEWKGVSPRTKTLLVLGLLCLMASIAVIGYGNYLGSLEAAAAAPKS
jgi:L-rhamnose-H+ transport protein